MNDYSDLLYTIMSIVIFSFLLLQANSLILRNDSVTVDHEYEKTAIAVAQSIIDEAKTRAFDSHAGPGNIPDGFNDTFGFDGDLGEDHDEEENPKRGFFTTFDDYHGYNGVVTTLLGDYTVDVVVTYVNNEAPFEEVGFKTTSKRMSVTATSADNNESATLVYIKSYVPGL